MPNPSLKLRSLTLAVALLCVPIANSQAPASPPPAATPAFDVVSIKPDKSASGSVHVSTRDASFEATNVSLKNLLRSAYGIREELISGIPSNFNSASFDIKAKVLDPDLDALKNLTQKQRNARNRLLLQQLLANRFQLKAHIEIKELPVYELVLAKGGPTFKLSPPAPPEGADIPKSPNSPGRGGTSIQGNGKSTELNASAVPMTSFADTLSYQVHRTVLDKTALIGSFDLSLKWTPEDAPALDNSANPESTAPAIFTALQEQLGLKLQPAKGPTDTLVIDHVEMPSEN